MESIRLHDPRKYNISKGILIAMFLNLALGIKAQNDDAIYTVVSMMKVTPDNTDSYISMESELWKPIHQELLAQEKILGWYFYSVEYTGTGDEYNYVTVTHYDGSENANQTGYRDAVQKVYPDKNPEEFFRNTVKNRDMVYSRMLEWVMQSLPEEQGDPAGFAVVNYMKVPTGMNERFLQIRRDYVKPVFDQAVKEGKVAGWGLWQLRFPSGEDMPFNFATGDFYNDFDKIDQNQIGEVYQQVHQEKDMNEILKEMNETKSMVKRELWRLIDYVR
jgi:hypothetical protein